MSILRHFHRLQFIDFLIRKKATGTLDVFARKNQLSKRGLSNVLGDMRNLGFPIKYSKTLNSYYYEEKGELVKRLFFKKVTGNMLHSDEEIDPSKLNNLCYSHTTLYIECGKSEYE